MKYNIAVLAGDGIGPEVTNQAIKILDSIADNSAVQFNFSEHSIGAESIKKHGIPLTEDTIEACKKSDAILFGAIGDPAFDNNPNLKVRPEQGLLQLRKALALYANIRPVAAFESLIPNSPLREEIIKGVDLVIYRELTGGIYFGDKGETENGSFDTCSYTKCEINRILNLAFKAAMKRNKKLTLVDKANVMATSRLWRKLAQEMSTDYPDVNLDMLFVDNAAMQLILNPRQFDVIVTSNMFGDILSDEASVIAGSLGLLASASIGSDTALFEPIHGSYPQAKGKNIANPIGSILSVVMLLDHLGEQELSSAINKAVINSFQQGVVSKDINAINYFSTEEIGSFIALDVAKHIQEQNVLAE